MIDIFGNVPIDLDKLVCHSGGAIGSDSYFSEITKKYGGITRAYSYKTKYHDSDDKVEISDSDYEEGVKAIQTANKTLGRFGIHRFMNLLARNWAQVKYSDEVFAIGHIIEPGKKCKKGYYNKSEFQIVSGGTGYAVQMAIDNTKTVYVFDQEKDKWFRWSYTSLSFRELKGTPVITSENFAGIGTREIKPNGILAIEEVYKLTFN
jgi:hypothetical protein